MFDCTVYIVFKKKQESHAWRNALEASTSIDEETKKRVMGVFNPEFMSSEDSASEDKAPNDSDDETPRRKEEKKVDTPSTYMAQ